MTSGQYALASEAWKAFRSPDPRELFEITSRLLASRTAAGSRTFARPRPAVSGRRAAAVLRGVSRRRPTDCRAPRSWRSARCDGGRMNGERAVRGDAGSRSRVRSWATRPSSASCARWRRRACRSSPFRAGPDGARPPIHAVAITDAGRDVLAGRSDARRAQRHRPLARRRPSRRTGSQSLALGRRARNVGIMSSRAMPELKDQPLHASTSEAVTNNVRVEVESQYAPEHSQPFQNHWFFHYTVRITNEGDETVQLLSRHWIITDATGHVEEVEGRGRRRRAAGAAARRVVPVHLRVSAEDLDRRDARHLSDGRPRTATTSTSRSRPSRSTNPTRFTERRRSTAESAESAEIVSYCELSVLSLR